MMIYQIRIGDTRYRVEINDITTRPVQVRVDGEAFEVWPEGSPDDQATPALAEARRPGVAVPPQAQGGPTIPVTSPMPGVVISLAVKEGDAVSRGDELLVLEAMKMMNPIRANRSGKVEALLVAVGDHVAKGQALARLSG